MAGSGTGLISLLENLLHSEICVRKLLRFALLLVALTSIGCAGFEPCEPPDDREEGPKSGLSRGAAGEFVILKRAGLPGAGKEETATESNSTE